MRALGFSDYQMVRLTNAASLLPSERRDDFMRSVANRLAGIHHPTDNDIHSAIGAVLGCYGISAPTRNTGNKHLKAKAAAGFHEAPRQTERIPT
jgi:hypothetical protein